MTLQEFKNQSPFIQKGFLDWIQHFITVIQHQGNCIHWNSDRTLAGLSQCPNEDALWTPGSFANQCCARGQNAAASLCNSSRCLIDLKRWSPPSGRLSTEHTRSKSIEEDVYADCPPYWLHPEYQSAAAAAGQHPNGCSRQLSAGACLLSGRREGVEEGRKPGGIKEGLTLGAFYRWNS